MTNSLFKDSHITQFCRPQTPYNYQSSGQHKSKSRVNNVTEYNSIRVYNNKPADKTTFCGFFSKVNPSGKSTIYTNEKVKNFIMMAAEKPAVFNAVFSIALTCLLRPAAIMALPGDSKHKDDKKYAAAHSIASGVIGYAISSAIFDPLGNGMKKLSSNLDKYLDKYPKLAYLKEGANGSKKSLSYMGRAMKYMSQVPEAIISPPKAMVTVALIPPILKYVFGWEKKKNQPKTDTSQKVQPPKVEEKTEKNNVEGSK